MSAADQAVDCRWTGRGGCESRCAGLCQAGVVMPQLFRSSIHRGNRPVSRLGSDWIPNGRVCVCRFWDADRASQPTTDAVRVAHGDVANAIMD